jgi:uncharacterized protein
MYIIDGHNLIPKIPGWSLRAMDDEEKLIALLQVYARVRRRSQIEVYFDGAPPGQSGTRVYGGIRAHFVPAAQTADDAIRRRLAELGRRARNASVVTSDRQVQANVRAAQARVIPSEDFARELLEASQEEELHAAQAKTKKAAGGKLQPQGSAPPGNMSLGDKKAPGNSMSPGDKMSPKELEGWLDLFGIDPSRADAPIEPPPRPAPPARRKKKKR